MTVTRLKMPASAVYLNGLGLAANPFPLAPDASRYFLTEPLEALVYELLFCIQQRKGFMVVSGEVGLGKTTLSRYLIAQLPPEENAVAVVLNSLLQGDDLLHQICLDFGLIDDDVQVSGRTLINRLNQFFLAQRRRERNCVIFIDDAQNLSIESLELIRVLSNLETDTEKLVQVVLMGQQELQTKLSAPALRQLTSRVALARTLEALTATELRRYVDYKLAVTANAGVITLSEAAHRAVHDYARGNLRRANQLMDRTLVTLLSAPTRHIEVDRVQHAIDDLRAPQRDDRPIGGTLAGDLRRASLGAGLTLAMVAALITWADWPISWPTSSPATAAPTVSSESSLPVAPPTTEAGSDTLQAVLDQFQLHDSADLWRSALARNDPSALISTVLTPAGLLLWRDGGLSPEMAWAGRRPELEMVAIDVNDGTERWWIWRPTFQIEALSFAQQSEAVMRLQQHLAAAGHSPGDIDGIAGPNTFSALLSFQRAHGLPVTGQVDDITLLWLHRQAATDWTSANGTLP